MHLNIISEYANILNMDLLVYVIWRESYEESTHPKEQVQISQEITAGYGMSSQLVSSSQVSLVQLRRGQNRP
jgi:hypothetical protein